MPDGTSRFRCDSEPLFHYIGCSTFANFTVLPEIALARVRKDPSSSALVEFRILAALTGNVSAVWHK
jgi:Zn-dependent alcohol dehydrogenase